MKADPGSRRESIAGCWREHDAGAKERPDLGRAKARVSSKPRVLTNWKAPIYGAGANGRAEAKRPAVCLEEENRKAEEAVAGVQCGSGGSKARKGAFCQKKFRGPSPSRERLFASSA